MSIIRNIYIIALLLLVSGNTAFAQQGTVEIKIEVKKVQVTTVYGEKKVKEVEARTVVPGDELIYTIHFTNNDRVPVDNIEITDPIPKATTYKAGSASGAGTDITFSVDGGRTYARPDELTVTDANGETRRARSADYTDIKWIYRPKLAPGKTGTASFRAIVK